jgi:uncharacterized protein
MKVIHKESQFVLGEDVKLADSFIGRLKGLMFIKEMKGMDGLILEPGNSIHNCFVRFPIDVIFLTNDNEIVKIIRTFKPWRFSWIYFRSRKVLELPNGTIPDHIKKGDYLEVLGV